MTISCGTEVGKTANYNSSLEEKYTPPVSGKDLFATNCSSCHGMDGKLGASGAKNLSRSKISDERIVKIINTGKGAMPPFGYTINTPTKMDSLVEFVKSLRK